MLKCSRSTVPLISHLLHVPQCDGLGLVAGVASALPGVSFGPGNSCWGLGQAVEQGHLLSQTQGAQVRLFLALTLALTLILVLALTLEVALYWGIPFVAWSFLVILHLMRLPDCGTMLS